MQKCSENHSIIKNKQHKSSKHTYLLTENIAEVLAVQIVSLSEFFFPLIYKLN